MATTPLPDNPGEHLATSSSLSNRFQVLNELMRIAVSSLDINEVIDAVGAQVQQLIDYSRLSIAVHPSGEDYVEMYAVTIEGQHIDPWGKELLLQPRGTRLPLRETAMGEAIRTGRPILRKNAPDDYVYPHEFEVAKALGFCSYMFVPLVAGGRIIGSLNLASRPDARYSEKELRIAQEIAEYLAVVLEHAWLNKQLLRQTEDLSFLNAISTAVNRTLDVSELLDLALGEIIGLTGMEGGAALLLDEDTQLLTLGADRNLPPAAKDLLQQHPISVGEFIPGLTAQRCEMLVVQNAKDDERELPPFRDIGIMTHVCIPLAVGGRALGVLGLADREARSFSRSELALFTTMGEQLGNAVEKARLFENRMRLAERLQTLNELMKIATSTLDMSEVFDRVGEQVKDLIDYTRLSIAIHPPGEDFIEMYAVTTEGQSVFPKGMRLPLHQTPMGEAIRTGRPILRRTPDAFVYPIEFEMAKTLGSSSYMFVPLESKGRVIGSLNVASRPEAEYTERELQTAEEIADHLAVVLEHAMLFEESKEAEETLRRLNKQLENVNQHKSEFLANMSHELRTPLNAVLGSSELLGEGLFGELNEKQKEYIQDIHESGNHLLSLINDVLDLSKVDAGKLDLQLSHFDLRSLVESSSAIVRERAARKSQEFIVVPPLEDVILEADERKVKQIVYNLLSNAVKFTEENGRVTFSAHREKHEVIFAVEDTGPGVAEELRERIFEEFFQISGNQEGTGLGLALSKRLVELHGGRIWLESQVGCGSRFFFSIPIRGQ